MKRIVYFGFTIQKAFIRIGVGISLLSRYKFAIQLMNQEKCGPSSDSS